jgi:phage-related protein
LRQLLNAGIPVNDILQEMGLSWDKLGKSSVSGQAFVDAFIGKAGEFSGAVDRMHGSWSAMLGALSDAKDVGLRELFAGVFTALQPVVQQFSDWMLGPGMEKLKQLGADLGILTVRLIAIGKALFTAGPFSQQFNVALGRLSPTLREIWEKISPFIQQGLAWISEHKQEVIAALTGMAVAFGALTVIGGIVALVSALANPLTLIIALVGLLSAAWAGNWGGIQQKTAIVLNWLRENIQAGMQEIKNIWDNVWGAIQAVINAILPIVLANIRAWQAALQGDWYSFGANMRQAWDATWKLIGQIVSNAWENIKASVKKLIDNVISFFTQTDWSKIGQSIIDGMISGLENGAGAFADALLAVVKAAIEALNGFLDSHSPSRLFRDEIAGNMMAGWIQGIQRMTPQLEMAVVGAGSRAAAAAKTINNYNLTVQSVRSAEQIQRDFWLMGAI